MTVKRTCIACGDSFDIPFKIPVNLTCQKCGCIEFNVSKNIYAECQKCEKKFNFTKGITNNGCHHCSENIVSVIYVFSDKKILPDPIELREKETTKAAIAIPYYQGDPRVERAVRTWIYPETVFILTDEKIIPPGSGVCSQLFISNTGRSTSLCKKTIPFIADIFANLLSNYPDKEFYGYVNSDIILPPGKSIHKLLPSKRKEISIHHRYDVSLNKEEPFIWKMNDVGQIIVGKDAFFISKRICKIIVEEFPKMLIGTPSWDTLLACWLYKRFGSEKIEFSYGEIWHEFHKSGEATKAEYDLPETKFNRKQLADFIAGNFLQIDEVWKTVVNDKKIDRTLAIKKKKIGLIQPGRLGDLIICLPIAKYFYDRDYEVVWPVMPSFASVFERAPYVNVIQLDADNGSYGASKTFFEKEKSFERIIDLGIGFGREQDSWNKSKLKFDEWKYAEAGVPIEEKYNLSIQREPAKEMELAKDLGLDNFRAGYVVTHSNSSFAKYRFLIPDAVEIKPIEGYHFFDWLMIIENALQIYCVDSSVCNLINQLGIGVGKRFIKTWHDIRSLNLANILTPRLAADWQHYNPIKYKDLLYPEYINDNNAISHVLPHARKFCIGKGLDLGGGANPFPGAQNLDIKKGQNVIEVLKGIKSKSHDFIFSSHFLEHNEESDQDFIINESFRILKEKGILFFYLPHADMNYWSIKNPGMGGQYGHKVDLQPDKIYFKMMQAGFKIIDFTDTPDHYWSFIAVGRKH